MKKKLRLIGVVLASLVLLYLIFTVFLGPDGFTKKEDLVRSYISSISDTNVCIEHFNEETTDSCTFFSNALSDEEISIESISITGDEAIVVLSVNENFTTFSFIFISSEVTGVKGMLYTNYYLIDYIN